jgi:hypothetical protein
MKLLLTYFALGMILFSCTKKDDGMACTMEFRTVQIRVIGAPLDDFYTIRVQTDDTLRHEHFSPGETDYYTVLDDNFQSILKGKTETFRFVGIRNDLEVVNEPIVIGADACHINYVSGNLVVEG